MNIRLSRQSENVTSQATGSNRSFTVAKYMLDGSATLFLNGQRLVKGLQYNQIDANTITIDNAQPAPASDDVVEIEYQTL